MIGNIFIQLGVEFTTRLIDNCFKKGDSENFTPAPFLDLVDTCVQAIAKKIWFRASGNLENSYVRQLIDRNIEQLTISNMIDEAFDATAACFSKNLKREVEDAQSRLKKIGTSLSYYNSIEELASLCNAYLIEELASHLIEE